MNISASRERRQAVGAKVAGSGRCGGNRNQDQGETEEPPKTLRAGNAREARRGHGPAGQR
jgi:hypothetical protein